MGSDPMVKKPPSRYALAPWGMQPNTSPAAHFPRFPWADFHSCLYTAYYTIFPYTSSTRSTCSTRLTIPHSSLFAYLVYFVVQFFASFAFFAAETSTRSTRLPFFTFTLTSLLSSPPRQIRRALSTTFSISIAKQPISTSPTLQHSPLRFSKDGSSLLRKSIFLQARSRLVGYCIFKYAIRKQYIKNRFFEFSSVCSTFFAHQFQCRTRNSTTRRNSFKNRFNRLALRT